MSVKLYKDKRQNDNGTFQLRVSVSLFGKRVVTTLGFTITDKEYQTLQKILAHEKVSSSQRTPKLSAIETMVQAIEKAVEWQKTKVAMHEIDKEQIDLLAIVNCMKGKTVKQQELTFTLESLFLDFIQSERRSKDLTEKTQRQFISLLHNIQNYKPDMKLDELNTVQGLSNFTEYMVARGLTSSSVIVTLNNLKWFLRWCFRNNYCDNEFEKYQCNLKAPSTKERLVLFLTLDELQKIKNVCLPKEIDQLIRDRFLFQCYTGLRNSDVAKLKKSDIKDCMMRVSIQKTGAYIENRLNKFALEIAEKYQQSGQQQELFPATALGKLEIHIKEIARMAGIDEEVVKVEYRNRQRHEYIVPKWMLITTHVARKSFVVNSLDLGLTATQVIAYTGHSTIQAMQPYISISQKKKDAAMDAWNDAHNRKED